MTLPNLNRQGKARNRGARFFLGMLAAALVGAAACGQVGGVPAAWEAESYAPVTLEQLAHPGRFGLSAGQRVKVPAYFWEYLTYDPAMVRNYLNLAARPRSWGRLRWFSVYEKPQMRGFFDLLALDREQEAAYRLKRLDRILVYGELAKMGGDLLYLRVHRLDNLEEEWRPDGARTP